MGQTLLPQLGWAPGIGERGATLNQWGEAAYISSCQHTKKKTWKENYVAWIALEAWLNACPCMFLTRVFQIGVGGIPLGGGDGNFAWRIRFTWWWKPEKWFWPFEPFQGQKQHSVNIEHLLKSKLAWPVCTMSMKLK